MAEVEPDRLIDALETEALQRGFREAGIEIASSEYDESTSPSREDIRKWFQENPEKVDPILEDFKRGAKLRTLKLIDSKLENIEEAKKGPNVVADALNLRSVYYYREYFGYTDHTTRIYHTHLDGVLAEIAENADDAEQAQEMFRTYCEKQNLDEYGQAAGDIPAPLITNLGDNPQPRLIHFEDANHLFVQYWERGNDITKFDIDTGNRESINTVYRPTLRIHLDSGLIESTGDRIDERNTGQIQTFLSLFNGSNSWTSPVQIGSSGIETTKDRLALQVSLDEFKGDDDDAKLRFARSESVGNVEADSKYADTEEERDRVRSNFQMILGQTTNGWELIYKKTIEEAFADWDPSDVTLSAVQETFTTDQPYTEVQDFTVSLNGDKDKQTIRILGKSREPSLERAIFHIFAKELGWRS